MFYQMILLRDHAPMNKELWEIRRDNLQGLIDAFPEAPGNRAAFCRKYELDPLQIGQYFTLSKNARKMGERKAREVEEKIGIRSGWLDDTHDAISSEVFEPAAPVAKATDFLSRMKGIQGEYELLGPEEKKLVDEVIEKNATLKKLLKPKNE